MSKIKTMRDQIAAGNWKMNTTISEGVALAKGLVDNGKTTADKMIVCVPFTHLAKISDVLSSQQTVFLAAQNLASEASGAYTGEVSAAMLKEAGVQYVLVGHSERRTLYAEDASILRKKIALAQDAGLKVIFCLGEPLEVREAGTQNAVVQQQLEDGIYHLSADEVSKLIIAYEPIWAIGTGKTASPEQAQDMHAYIRSSLETKYGSQMANAMSILYGGSVKPANSKEIFSQPDVDGGLVGGASLKLDSFVAIANSF